MRFSKLSTPASPHVKLAVSELIQLIVGIGFPLKRYPASRSEIFDGGNGSVGYSSGAANTCTLHSKETKSGRRFECFWFPMTRQGG